MKVICLKKWCWKDWISHAKEDEEEEKGEWGGGEKEDEEEGGHTEGKGWKEMEEQEGCSRHRSYILYNSLKK